MAMPQLEVRAFFDARAYGAEYISVPSGIDVELLEDASDGWVLVQAAPGRVGWVPRAFLQPCGLCAAEIAVEEFLKTFHKVKGGVSRNQIVGNDAAQMKHLAFLPACCRIFSNMLERVIEMQQQHPESSFEALGLKAGSQDGYDVHKGKMVDYGNREYPVLLWSLALCDANIMDRLGVLGNKWPTLLPHQTSDNALVRQGDFIELLLATLRGGLFASQLTSLSGTSLPSLNLQLCNVMRFIHLLQGRVSTGRLKYKQEPMSKWASLFEVTAIAELWETGDPYYQATVVVEIFRHISWL